MSEHNANNTDGEVFVKYIVDYKLNQQNDKKEFVLQLIPGMENEADNITIDQYANAAKYNIKQLLEECENIPNTYNIPTEKNKLREFEFDVFRILEKLDSAFNFLQTDVDYMALAEKKEEYKEEYKQEINKIETNIKRMTKILGETAESHLNSVESVESVELVESVKSVKNEINKSGNTPFFLESDIENAFVDNKGAAGGGKNTGRKCKAKTRRT